MKSWLKYISLLALLILGLFTPKLSKACAQPASKPTLTTCSAKQEPRSDNKTSPKAKPCEKGNQHKDCKDKCERHTCDCSSAARFFGLPTRSILATQQHVVVLSKQQFSFKKAHYPRGYFSIWLPPKIS